MSVTLRAMLAASLIGLALASARVAAVSGEARCTKIEKRIDWIESRLRAGYKAAQGERWRAELRRLKAERRRTCR